MLMSLSEAGALELSPCLMSLGPVRIPNTSVGELVTREEVHE